MSDFLTQAREQGERESAPLRELKRVKHAGSAKVLAVCERSGGTLVLCIEREQGKRDPADPINGKRAKEHGTEKVLKPTAALADFAHAVDAGLL